MPGNFKKEDLRIKKTYRALELSLLTLLNQKNFNQITVNDLCCEALISRAAFYLHFNDKYDLLEYWLLELSKAFRKNLVDFEKTEADINLFIENNRKLITNVLSNANNEVLDLVNNFISSIVDEAIETYRNTENKNVEILSEFCTGGITHLLLLQVKKHFPPDNKMVSLFLFNMIINLMEWANELEKNQS